MAACGRLQHIFEKPLPESPKLLEPLSLSPWKGIKTSVDSPPPPSCRDFFGDLHFKEHHHHHHNHHHHHDHHDVSESSSPSQSQYQSPLSLDHSSSYKSNPSPVSSSTYSFFEDVHHHHHDNGDDDHDHNKIPYTPIEQYKHSDSFSSKNSESLSMCTEGLGFESFDDVDDLISSNDTTSFDFYNHHHHLLHHDHQNEEKTQGFPGNVQFAENSCNKESKRGVMNNNNNKGKFPPPISCIGRTGKPWVSFKSFRDGGRFILQEIRKPTQEFLHACREDGRLRLQFIHSDDEILEEEEEEEDDEDKETEEEKEKEPDDDDDNHEIKEENGETEATEI